MEIEKNNKIEIKNELVNEKSQKNFLESTLGKTINTAIDIGIRALLPDFIDEQVINIKNNLIKNEIKEGINKTIDDAIDIGKSTIGIVTGNFENVNQMQTAVKTGGIIDGISTLLDTVVNKVQSKGLIDYNVARTIKEGKNIILNNVESNIEKTFTDQIKSAEYTNKYILLKDMQYAIVSKDKVQIFNNDLNAIDYEEKIANCSISNYQKNGYEHFMLKEMHEQPQAIYNIFNSFFENKNSTYESINLFSYSKIDIVACGSAMHAGLVGKYLFESYLNIPTNVEIASEYRYKKLLPKKDTLVIIISQSGETADSLAALKLAKSCGATTLAICNVAFSTISREANITLNTSAGPEIAVATTKGYTTQIAMLTTLVLNELRRKDELDSLDLKLLHSNLKDISKIFDEVFNRKNEFLEIANKLKDKNDLFFIGRGLDYYLCMEGSLKLKEISYMHSEAYSAGELKHGTISLITEDMPVIAIATDEDLILKTISNVQEVKSRGAYTIFITTEELAKKYDLKFNDITLILKTLHPLLKSNLIALSLQLIAYETAKIKGCNIDQPKNLAKSVTVE